jgi:heme exporter protein C
MEKLAPLARPVFALLVGVVSVWSFLVPDAPTFQRPELARIFFWHFPCPMMLTGLLFVGVYFSLRRFLRVSLKGVQPEADRTERGKWDVRAEAALELGFLFAILTMATGILFSLVQWGAWWQWDPRQTSFLIALLIYGAYFALRASFNDPQKRGDNAAAYMLAAFLPLVFLIFVYPRLPQVQQVSFHPTDSIMGGQIKGSYAQVISAMMVVTTILSVWLYRLRVRAGLLELRVIENGYLETRRGDSASAPVVRPVRLSSTGE